MYFIMYFKYFTVDKIGQFCHIESRGKNSVASLIKLQLTSFFLHNEAYSFSIHISLLVFTNYSRSYKMAP